MSFEIARKSGCLES